MSGFKRRHIAPLVVGWYCALSFPKDDSILSLALSIVAATIGVFLVGVACYDAGREAES